MHLLFRMLAALDLGLRLAPPAKHDHTGEGVEPVTNPRFVRPLFCRDLLDLHVDEDRLEHRENQHAVR